MTTNQQFKQILKSLDLHTHTIQLSLYYRNELKKFPKLNIEIIEASSILLACKQTDINRKQRDIINVYYKILTGNS